MERVIHSPFPHSLSISFSFPHSLSISSQPGSKAPAGCDTLYDTLLRRRGNKDQEKVFEEELKKHDKTVAFIKQNIAAQENIIRCVSCKNRSVHMED